MGNPAVVTKAEDCIDAEMAPVKGSLQEVASTGVTNHTTIITCQVNATSSPTDGGIFLSSIGLLEYPSGQRCI